MDLLATLPVSLRQLQYIVAVADRGSFRRAAEACHVAQPSLSAQVAVAERALGVQLFERTGRRVRVPAAAAPLVAQARKVLIAAGDLRELARATTRVRPEVLDGERVLLLDDGHCFRDQALELCARTGAIEGGFRATSLSTLVQMVSARGGVTLLPAIALPVENRRGQLAVRSFAAPGPGRTLALVWRRGSALRAPLERIAETIRQEL